jgi:aryl-phospho-beta-D-glucosidase BglC (GH1 family)
MATDRNTLRFGATTHLIGLGTNPSGVGRMKMVEVTSTGDYFGANAPAIGVGFEDLFKALIGLDGANEPALMVAISETVTTGTSIVAANRVPEDFFQNLKKFIGKQSDGRPCLRLTIDRI